MCFFCRPVILIFDSLPNTSKKRVVITLKEYLACEWKAKHGGSDQTKCEAVAAAAAAAANDTDDQSVDMSDDTTTTTTTTTTPTVSKAAAASTSASEWTKRILDANVEVPTQTNYYDCGIYLLQYVESFFRTPIGDFNLPIRLPDWFTLDVVEAKRAHIRSIILEMERKDRSTISHCCLVVRLLLTDISSILAFILTRQILRT